MNWKDLNSMRIDYNRLKVLNFESMVLAPDNRYETMSCFYIIQNGVEKVINGEVLSDTHKNLLIELGVLIEPTMEERKKIVEPFKMNMGNDRPQSN